MPSSAWNERPHGVLLVDWDELRPARAGQLGPNPGHVHGFSSLGHGSPFCCEGTAFQVLCTKEILRHAAIGASSIKQQQACFTPSCTTSDRGRRTCYKLWPRANHGND